MVAMTTEAKQPSAFTRVEGAARHTVMQIGLGVAAYVLGSIFASGAMGRISERVGLIDSEAVAFVYGWVMQRLWLFVVLPMFGWAAGRFTELRSLRFAVTAALSGELFALLLFSAINGLDPLLENPGELLARGVTLLLGMAVTLLAVSSGRRAAAVAQAEADAIAVKQKAEYAEYLAKLEGPAQSPASGQNEPPK